MSGPDEKKQALRRTVAADPSDTEAGEALEREEQRDGTEPVVVAEAGHVLEAPYCSKCGESPTTLHVRLSARLPIEPVWVPYMAEERTIHGTTDRVRLVEHVGYPSVQVSEATPFEDLLADYEKTEREQSVDVNVECEKGHRWDTSLRVVPLEPKVVCAGCWEWKSLPHASAAGDPKRICGACREADAKPADAKPEATPTPPAPKPDLPF